MLQPRNLMVSLVSQSARDAMSRIYTYLNSISSGQPINFEAFAKELKKHGKGAGYLFDTFQRRKLERAAIRWLSCVRIALRS